MARLSRLKLLVALLLAFALVASACGDDDDTGSTGTSETPVEAPEETPEETPAETPEETPAETPEETPPMEEGLSFGGHITVGIDSETTCYVPNLCSGTYGPAAVRWSVVEPLTEAAANIEGWTPLLAESIVPNDDASVWTATIQEGAAWSDGEPVTAAHVVETFELGIMAEGSSIRGAALVIASVEATDDRTVVFTLVGPTSPFPTALATLPVWRYDASLTETDLPIGSGPFKFDNWEQNVEVNVSRSDFYWGKNEAGEQLPYLDSITFVPIPSGDTRVNALDAGDVDMIMSSDPIDVANMRKIGPAPGVPLNAGVGLFFNNSADGSGAPVDDVRVKKALTAALDKSQILALIGGGEERDQYYTMASPWWSQEVADASVTFDPAVAKQFMDEYINDPARSDGKAVGDPIAVELSYSQGQIFAEQAVVVAQQNWQDAGFEVTILTKDRPTLISDAGQANFQVNWFGWAVPHPHGGLIRNYGPPETTPTNFAHYGSDEIYRLTTEIASETDPQAQLALIHESSMVFANDPPVIFLASTELGWGHNDRFTNVEIRDGDGFVLWPSMAVSG